MKELFIAAITYFCAGQRCHIAATHERLLITVCDEQAIDNVTNRLTKFTGPQGNVVIVVRRSICSEI